MSDFREILKHVLQTSIESLQRLTWDLKQGEKYQIMALTS